jgi:hypothetical protein
MNCGISAAPPNTMAKRVPLNGNIDIKAVRAICGTEPALLVNDFVCK